MSQHTATIVWSNSDSESFRKGQYSRVHEWRLDGGAVVPGSASPSVVRAPWSSEAAVDPEEGFLAAISSCHMLWFLDFARRAGLAPTVYEDEASADLEKCDDGRVRITKVCLKPRIAWDGEAPDAAALERLHHDAHEACFIANSITSEVTVESSQTRSS